MPLLLAFGLSGGLVGTASAQLAGSRTPEAIEQAHARAQALFGTCQSQFRGTARNGSETLLNIASAGLPATPANAAALRALMVSNVTLDEKRILVKLLGAQYAPDDPSRLNQQILADLRGYAKAQDADLARRAVFTYSRLGFFADTHDILLAAKSRGLLDDQAYIGELAHLLTMSSGADQIQLAQMIGASKSAYARDIVTMDLTGPVGSRLSAAARAELLPFLQNMELRFGITVSQYDYGQGLDYSYWLRALAAVKVGGTDAQQAEFMMRALNVPNIDPRKVIAVLMSPFGSWLVTTVGDRSRFDGMIQTISLYPRQFPQNPALVEVVQYAKRVVGSP